jgi:hypothetical protein
MTYFNHKREHIANAKKGRRTGERLWFSSSVDKKTKKLYANAYAVEREYGGAEEGGWWYNAGTPLASIPVYSEEEGKTVSFPR